MPSDTQGEPPGDARNGASSGESRAAGLSDASNSLAYATPPKPRFLRRCYVAVVDTLLDMFSAFAVWATYLITFETLLLCVLTVGAVTFYMKARAAAHACCTQPSRAGRWRQRGRGCAVPDAHAPVCSGIRMASTA